MGLPPQGFGPEAKTRGGTLGFPACIDTETFKRVRNVLVVREAFPIYETRRARWSKLIERLSMTLTADGKRQR